MRVGSAPKAEAGLTLSCAVRRLGLAAAVLLACPLALKPIAAAADTRTINLHNIHTHENLSIVFKKDGRYDQDALKKLNTFLRDWRKEQEVRMDPQLFDMLWEVHREVKASGPIHVVCGYRSPQTNAMLRRRSGGVARTSLHMQGKAIDFSIPSANVADVRAAALRIQGGGVGYYPTSGIPFVHMDVGNVRHWPRMTRDQLAKVFPDGRTVHVPSDGNPLPGYELALADVENGTRRSASPKQRSLIAALFSAAQEAEEAGDNAAVEPAPVRSNARRAAPPASPAPVQVAVAPVAAAPAVSQAPVPAQVAAVVPPVETAPVPLPRSRPTYEVATAESRPAPAPAPRVAAPVNIAALSPSEIVNMRGFWDGLPEAPPDLPKPAADPAAQSLTIARNLLARSLASTTSEEMTAAIGPFVRPDRVPPDVALAYAAQADSKTLAPRAATGRRVNNQVPAAVVTNKGVASVAIKPAETIARSHLDRTAERLNDPWMRGLVLAKSVQHSLTVTIVGDPDFRSLAPHLRQPPSAVMMTFSHDPHLGMTADAFTGSAVVFQATVTFGDRRTASLQ